MRSAPGAQARAAVAAVATAAVAAMLVVGPGLLPPAAASLPYPLPAPPVQPEPCPPPPVPPSPPPPPLGPPAVPDRAIPVAQPPKARRVDLAPISGKGIWLTAWPGQRLDVAAVAALARRDHLHQLWLRTGSSQSGFYGGATLSDLARRAHAAGIDVIAWDFPTLSDPAADARRAAQDFAAGADGFAADIESSAEGTYLSARRVAYYLSLVRRDAGSRPVVAVVPRPLRYWLESYPYRAEAPFVDAFAPMVYWSCTEPGRATLEAIRGLDRLRPVVPIGQDYNMASEGGRHGLPTGAEVWRFLDVARRGGAIGASLYDLEAGGTPDLTALGAYPWPPVPGHAGRPGSAARAACRLRPRRLALAGATSLLLATALAVATGGGAFFGSAGRGVGRQVLSRCGPAPLVPAGASQQTSGSGS